MPPLNESLIAEMQEDWESGMSYNDMASKYGYASKRSLSSRLYQLREQGYVFELRDPAIQHDTSERRKRDKKLIKLVKKGLSRTEIAAELQRAESTVFDDIKRLIESGDLPEDATQNPRLRSDDENQRLVDAYRSGAPLRQIASQFGFASAMVVSVTIGRLREQGYNVGPPRRRGGSK